MPIIYLCTLANDSNDHPYSNVDCIANEIPVPYRMEKIKNFIYRRPTLYPLEIAVDFLKSL